MRIIFSLVVLLAWCRAASAQQFGSYVYAGAVPVVVPRSDFTRWNGSFVYAGGGGEARSLTDSVWAATLESSTL